jgi:formate hydrogenlyase subunit 6/NADH:ubiquinone oxidoreductase subunit I
VACSTAVFHLPAFPTSELSKPRDKTLTVACMQAQQEDAVRVPCLGDLEPVLLGALAQRGVAVTLYGADRCAACSNAPQGGACVEALIDAMDALAVNASALWTTPVLGSGSEKLDYDAERRQLFRRFSNRAVESVRSVEGVASIPESAIRAAAHFVPPRRRLAESLLQGVSSQVDDSLLPVLLGVADIEPGTGPCTGCDLCARVCPTGALKVSELESQWALQFQIGQCVGCGVCIEACSSGALSLHQRWRPMGDAAEVVHELNRYRCQVCGRYFVGVEAESCPVCEDDQESFDAIFG